MTITKETTKVMREWLKVNDFDCGCRLGTCFEYDPCDYIITVQKNYKEDYDTDLMEVFRTLGMTTNFDIITLSFLHELGHFATLDTMTEKAYAKDIFIRESVIAYIEDDHDRNITYWNLKSEKMANEWVVDFCETYPEIVQDLEDRIAISIIW